jgi:hypothetical protein
MSGATSGANALDLRAPIGVLFSALGALLAGYGLLTAGDPMYDRSGGVNLNLWWGAVMLAFGALMLAGALRARAAARGAGRGADRGAAPAPGSRG